MGNTTDTIRQKEEILRDRITSMESMVLGFSGGVDSTLLAYVGTELLKDRCLCVTVREAYHSQDEFEESVQLAETFGFRQKVYTRGLVDRDFIRLNPRDRCYACKREIFSFLESIRAQEGFRYLADGSNVDDLGDYRPGLQALNELHVRSPLREAGLTKEDIRTLSRKYGLPTWNKPAFACLASRIPYGEDITPQKLRQVEAGERILRELGFVQYRLRHHGDIARIEVARQERARLFDEALLDQLGEKLRQLGFRYVTIDVMGYQMGSLN